MLLPHLSSSGLPLIVGVFWLSISDAIPFEQHSTKQVRPTGELAKNAFHRSNRTMFVGEQIESVTGTSKTVTDSPNASPELRRLNSNVNTNINMNKMDFVSIRSNRNHLKSARKRRPIKKIKIYSKKPVVDVHKQSNNNSDINTSNLDTGKKKVKKEESTDQCVNEARRQNQTYTRSFSVNTSIDLGEEFKVTGAAEGTKTSSIHTGEDIAVCWIELTTIKEDRTFDPPKKLVIREFTISFENSATIPDNYLECNKIEGEIAPGDEKTTKKTAFNEVIEENTKRSRIANFTSVTHVGPIVVRQHKSVRCAVGAVVSKDIYEWSDGTDNPKKRVEVKVGPSIRHLGNGSGEDHQECTNEDQSTSSGSGSASCQTVETCEDGGECNKPTASSSCDGDDCSSQSSSEEFTPSTYLPDNTNLSSTVLPIENVTKQPEESIIMTKPTTVLPHKPEGAGNDSCPDGGSDCGFTKDFDSISTTRADIETLISDSTTHLPGLIANAPLLEANTNSTLSSSSPVTVSLPEHTTLPSESCESGTCGTTKVTVKSVETIQTTPIIATETTKRPGDSSCEENDESCQMSVSGPDNENCEDGSAETGCTNGTNSTTPRSCDSASGSCSEETSNPTVRITTMTQRTPKDLDNSSTTFDNVLTTAETRRTTLPTSSLTTPVTKGRHRLALRIKILLEHINENKEKEKLVQVEKHLLLTVKPNEHGNHSLLSQIKSLNNSMNFETLKAIFNCTTLDNLSEDVTDLKESGEIKDEKVSLHKKPLDPDSVSSSGSTDESQDSSKDESDQEPARKKRQVFTSGEYAVIKNGENKSAKANAIRKSLPGVHEDFEKGLNHVLYRISDELNAPTTNGVNKTAKSSSSKILKILADPNASRVEHRRKKRATHVEGMAVEQLKYPVNGEEIDRWTNERFVDTANGGRVRSFTDFTILSNPVKDSQGIPS